MAWARALRRSAAPLIASVVGVALCERERRRGTLASPETALNVSAAPCSCHDRSQEAFSRQAVSYDDDIGKEEFFMGVKLLRWWLLRQMSGRVLEVACGTGRNLEYLVPHSEGREGGVTSLTMVDSNEEMLAVAKGKARSFLQSGRVGSLDAVKVVRASAASLPFEDGSFDSVCDTFGLCSMDDPVAALKEMRRVCAKGGRVYLLEHGRATWEWLNSILDRSSDAHFAKWGCRANKDIEKLVAASGMTVLETQRWHFGTTYVYVCEPAK
jgi:methyltransferase OMS1, mitochondrial